MYKPGNYERHFGKYVFAKQHKYKTHLRKCRREKVPRHRHRSEDGSVVTFTWTRPIQTQEIVLPPASPHIIHDFKCLRVTEAQQLQQLRLWAVDCTHTHTCTRTRLQTHTRTSLEVTTGVHMPSVHEYAKTLLPSPVRTVLTTHTHTGACTLHPCSVQPPHPAQSSHPRGLCVRIRL